MDRLILPYWRPTSSQFSRRIAALTSSLNTFDGFEINRCIILAKVDWCGARTFSVGRPPLSIQKPPNGPTGGKVLVLSFSYSSNRLLVVTTLGGGRGGMTGGSVFTTGGCTV